LFWIKAAEPRIGAYPLCRYFLKADMQHQMTVTEGQELTRAVPILLVVDDDLAVLIR
jgi:hypothetical protein